MRVAIAWQAFVRVGTTGCPTVQSFPAKTIQIVGSKSFVAMYRRFGARSPADAGGTSLVVLSASRRFGTSVDSVPACRNSETGSGYSVVSLVGGRLNMFPEPSS